MSELDYISDIDYETFTECTVKYNFSYDYESNIVTIAAAATLPDGSIEIDEISGVGFINDEDEIDAVMNIDGEGVLLSEMRNAGMIENCGWFFNLIKNIAKAVAVVAVAAVAVAAVVVTAGMAAPAVVGAGVAVASTVVGTAVTIAGYATITAAIAAGVALTVDLVEKYYPGVDAYETLVNNKKTVCIRWGDDEEEAKKLVTQYITQQLSEKESEQKPYLHVLKPQTNKVNMVVDIEHFYSKTEMAHNMKTVGWSSLTLKKQMLKK